MSDSGVAPVVGGGPRVEADASPTGTLVVFDIDGVLADPRHRLHHLSDQPKDWEAFFAEADTDPPLPDGFALIRRLASEHTTLYLTGRPERNRPITQAWLTRHDLPRGRLLMRPNRDRRPAREFKREALLQVRRTSEIALVVDDDPAVIKALAHASFRVQLADWLPYATALQHAQERDGRT